MRPATCKVRAAVSFALLVSGCAAEQASAPIETAGPQKLASEPPENPEARNPGDGFAKQQSAKLDATVVSPRIQTSKEAPTRVFIGQVTKFRNSTVKLYEAPSGIRAEEMKVSELSVPLGIIERSVETSRFRIQTPIGDRWVAPSEVEHTAPLPGNDRFEALPSGSKGLGTRGMTDPRS